MSHFQDLSEKFSKINFTQMSNIEISKWLRSEAKIGLSDSLRIANVIKKAYTLGTIRSAVVNK